MGPPLSVEEGDDGERENNDPGGEVCIGEGRERSRLAPHLLPPSWACTPFTRLVARSPLVVGP
mgnify:CR=1 FL=1